MRQIFRKRIIEKQSILGFKLQSKQVIDLGVASQLHDKIQTISPQCLYVFSDDLFELYWH